MRVTARRLEQWGRMGAAELVDLVFPDGVRYKFKPAIYKELQKRKDVFKQNNGDLMCWCDVCQTQFDIPNQAFVEAVFNREGIPCERYGCPGELLPRFKGR